MGDELRGDSLVHLNVRFSTEAELKQTLDFLYEKSKEGIAFTGLVEAMVNEVTIVIRKNDFAVSLMQVSRDGKIPVARLEEYEEAIMSPAYPIFRVKDKNVILPEYLEMWFKRPEFDREAAFIAVGGVRGSMPWEEFAKMKLPVPPIEKQRKIVNAYKIVTDRIALKQKINDNLVA